MDKIHEDVRRTVIARTGHIFSKRAITYLYEACPGVRTRCQIISAGDRTVLHYYGHEDCYKVLLSFIPPVRTFAQRRALMTTPIAPAQDCLIHIRKARAPYGNCFLGGVCEECRQEHLTETDYLVYLFFSVRHMGLLSDIVALLSGTIVEAF
jgi:hypothetical protein